MPLVRVTTTPQQGEHFKKVRLGIALSEIVPAAFNSEQGNLTPGSICFMGSSIELDSAHLLTVDCFVEIEAYFYEDRHANLDERCEQVRIAMEEIFQSYTFAVWGKLVTAGWSRKQSDPDFDGDMSMHAATNRARRRLGLRETVLGGKLPR